MAQNSGGQPLHSPPSLPVINYEYSMKNAVSLLKTSLCFIKSGYAEAFRLARHPLEGLKSLYGVSLYRNAVYLMADIGVTAIFGLVFWGVMVRLYPAEDVGLGQL